MRSDREKLRRAAVVVAVVATWTAASAPGHDLKPVDVTVTFPGAARFVIDFRCDPDSLMFGYGPWHARAEDYEAARRMPPAELAERVAAVRRYIERRFRVAVDGRRVPFEISFPEHGAPAGPAAGVNPPDSSGGPNGASQPGLPGHTARLTGTLPAGATHVVVGASRAFGLVNLTVRRADGETHDLLAPGQDSAPIPVAGPRPPPGVAAAAVQYLVVGFEHILPKGLDHILFVLGLFLLSPKLGPLLWQVTAFTAAHTLTLALSMYGVASLPASVVEPLIAASIACVAIENLFTSELKPWRPAVVFAFGLLHGLGFAGVLTELGLPRERFLVALLSFNVGVELGQLAVVGAAFAVVGWARRSAGYRRRVTLPASLAIACVGLYWAVERTFL